MEYAPCVAPEIVADAHSASVSPAYSVVVFVPRAAAAQIDNLNRKLGGLFARACFVERQEQAAVKRLPRAYSFARQRRVNSQPRS